MVGSNGNSRSRNKISRFASNSPPVRICNVRESWWYICCAPTKRLTQIRWPRSVQKPLPHFAMRALLKRELTRGPCSVLPSGFFGILQSSFPWSSRSSTIYVSTLPFLSSYHSKNVPPPVMDYSSFSITTSATGATSELNSISKLLLIVAIITREQSCHILRK